MRDYRLLRKVSSNRWDLPCIQTLCLPWQDWYSDVTAGTIPFEGEPD